MTSAARRRWFALVMVLLVALVGAGLALAAEWAVRRRERTRARPTDMMTTLYYRHSRLVRGLVRNRDYYGWVRTDSLGLRASSPVPGEAPETLRILADGGSTTFDVGVTVDDSTWPARLARLLSDSTRHVQVFNAGAPSYLVLDNLIRFEQELHRLRPHLILLLQGHNDLYEMLHPAAGDPDAPGEAATATPWGRWLERHSLLYGKASAAVRNAMGRLGRHQSSPPPEAMRASLERGLAQFEADVRSYVAVAHALGAHVVLIEPVHVSSGTGEANASAAELWGHAFGAVDTALVLEGYARERDALRRVAAATGADFIPTDGFGLDSTRFYGPGDPIHFNDDGARVMAERLRVDIDRIVRLHR